MRIHDCNTLTTQHHVLISYGCADIINYCLHLMQQQIPDIN